MGWAAEELWFNSWLAKGTSDITRVSRLAMWSREGGQKFLELLQKIYLKYLYKFETLVYFTVLPLWLGGPVLALHSLLETLSKLFDGNAVKGRQWFSLNLCNVRKMPPFKIMLHLWVQKKVIRREVRRVGGGGTQPPFRFYQKTAGRSKAVWTGALSWCMNQSPL